MQKSLLCHNVGQLWLASPRSRGLIVEPVNLGWNSERTLFSSPYLEEAFVSFPDTLSSPLSRAHTYFSWPGSSLVSGMEVGTGILGKGTPGLVWKDWEEL